MNNSLVKEAENIINEYIRENRYSILPDRRRKVRADFHGSSTLVNTLINLLLMAAVAFLIFAASRVF